MRSFCSVAALALLLGAGALGAAAPAASQPYAEAGVSVEFAPPPLPLYDQPPLPGPGYIWTPGYWAWDEDYQDYYWVPGTWVLAPRYGWLWTPPWWGWDDGAYIFHSGYWGPRVGFYGGINYGFGYTGSGFYGGEWRGNRFYYNRTVNNVRNMNIGTVYNRPIPSGFAPGRVSFNGGSGGVRARPTPEQLTASRDPHIGATPVQTQHFQLARSRPDLRASFNHGAPRIAATPRPTSFGGGAALPARNPGSYQPVVGARPGPGYRGERPDESPYGARPNVGPGGRPPGEGYRPENSYRPPGGGYRPEGGYRPPAEGYRPAPNGYRPPAEGSRPAPDGYRPQEGYRPAPNVNRPQEGYRPPPGAGYRPPQQAFHPPPQAGFRPPPQNAGPRPPPTVARPAPAPRPAPAEHPNTAPHDEHH